MLLWVMFSVLSAYQANAREVCYGEDYTFPFFTGKQMKENKVFFTPKSPLDPDSDSDSRVVMDGGKPLDSRFITDWSLDVKLLNVSMDYEGEYSIPRSSGSHRRKLIFTLVGRDCSIKEQVEYGGSYSFDVSRLVEQIDYSTTFNDRQTPVILWDRTEATERARGKRLSGIFEVKWLTHTDQGFYTLRGKEGKFYKRYHLTIQAIHQDHYNLVAGEDFTISFPVNGVRFTLIHEPDHRLSTTLITNGYLHSEALDGRLGLLSTGVEIRELEEQDTGTFTFQDHEGNVAMVVNLHVNTASEANYFVIVGAVFAVSFLSCCVLCAILRKKSRRTTTAVTQVYHHETTNDQGQRQPYSLVINQPPYNPSKPLASAANQQHQALRLQSLGPVDKTVVAGDGGFLGPSSKLATSADVGPIHYQGSAAGGVDAPTINLGFDCLSSDSGPQFEAKGLNYPLAPLLSTDTPSCDVYTSDKLNFL